MAVDVWADTYRRGKRSATVAETVWRTWYIVLADRRGMTVKACTFPRSRLAHFRRIAVDWCAHGVSWARGFQRGVEPLELMAELERHDGALEIFGSRMNPPERQHHQDEIRRLAKLVDRLNTERELVRAPHGVHL